MGLDRVGDWWQGLSDSGQQWLRADLPSWLALVAACVAVFLVWRYRPGAPSQIHIREDWQCRYDSDSKNLTVEVPATIVKDQHLLSVRPPLDFQPYFELAGAEEPAPLDGEPALAGESTRRRARGDSNPRSRP